MKYDYPLQAQGENAHAAVGRHLRSRVVDIALARDLHPILADAHSQVTYACTAAERSFDHAVYVHEVGVELGYFLSPQLSLNGAVSWEAIRGGIEWDLRSAEFVIYVQHHDRLANQRSWRVGGGAGWALTPRYVVYLYGLSTVAGANTHAMNTIANGLGWTFASPWIHAAARRNLSNQ